MGGSRDLTIEEKPLKNVSVSASPNGSPLTTATAEVAIIPIIIGFHRFIVRKTMKNTPTIIAKYSMKSPI